MARLSPSRRENMNCTWLDDLTCVVTPVRFTSGSGVAVGGSAGWVVGTDGAPCVGVASAPVEAEPSGCGVVAASGAGEAATCGVAVGVGSGGKAGT